MPEQEQTTEVKLQESIDIDQEWIDAAWDAEVSTYNGETVWDCGW